MPRRRQRRRREKERRHTPSPVTPPATADGHDSEPVERLVYSREQAAQALGVSLATLDRRVIPAIATVKTEWGARLIPAGALERYLAERTEQPRMPRRGATRSGRRSTLPTEVVARIRREHRADAGPQARCGVRGFRLVRRNGGGAVASWQRIRESWRGVLRDGAGNVRVVDDRLAEFGELFGEFVRVSLEAESRKEPEFRGLLRDHLGAEPGELPVVAEDVPAWDHANLQLGLEALFAREERTVRLAGIGGGQKRFMALSLSDLINEQHFRPGPVEYENVAVGPGRTHPCILFGLALLRDEKGPAVLLVRRGDPHGPSPGLQAEAMTPKEDRSAELLGELRELMRVHNVFRGQMISLESTMWGQVRVAFHERPALHRDDVILPEQVLRDIERHTLGIGRRTEALLASDRHLKRGMLLHGPPGTGKTHTVKWLAAELSNATVIVLAGGSLGVAGPVCRLARELTPSLVVLEDVDLVAEERTMMPPQAGPVLFELLNELDGMADDADIAVVLTTNRPDLLEPALAARPGRVDLAVELPLPDEACRRRLIELYASGLRLDLRDPDTLVERSAGVTASFFRELLRQAALEAAEQESASVRDRHVAAALERLLSRAGTMTRILLGASPPSPDGASVHASRAWLTPPQPHIDEM